VQNRWPEGLCLRFGRLVKKNGPRGRHAYEAWIARISILAGGNPETGYVDADRLCHPNFTLADGAGHTFF
jgi:hypothetical protein